MISRSASYAIRALSFMAANAPTEWTLNREIARELALPPQFLTKILRSLASVGILASQRGKSGGFRLAKRPEQITLLDVVDAFDHVTERRRCLLGQAACSDESACALHSEWTIAYGTMLRMLEDRTLADLSAAGRVSCVPRRGAVAAGPAATGTKEPRN